MNIDNTSFSLANLTFKYEIVPFSSASTTYKFSTPFKNKCLTVIPFDTTATQSDIYKIAVNTETITKESCQLFAERGNQAGAILAIGY